ncbi:hypothetical protein MJO29_014721 [Puccinia striiformis f. sp. tritici]|nr:hypothetical protein MJO29_014721 [Puccinia striiformis f. sp. tritici]
MSDTGGGDSTGGSVGELVQGGGGAFFILVRAIGQSGWRVDPRKEKAARTRTSLEVRSARRLPEPDPQPNGSRVSPWSTRPIYILNQLSPALTAISISPALTGISISPASPVSISPALTGMNLTGISISPALIGINPTSSHWYQSHQLSPVSLSHPLSPALTGMNLYGSHQLSLLSSVSISPVLISPVSLSHQLSSVSISPALIGINLTGISISPALIGINLTIISISPALTGISISPMYTWVKRGHIPIHL